MALPAAPAWHPQSPVQARPPPWLRGCTCEPGGGCKGTATAAPSSALCSPKPNPPPVLFQLRPPGPAPSPEPRARLPSEERLCPQTQPRAGAEQVRRRCSRPLTGRARWPPPRRGGRGRGASLSPPPPPPPPIGPKPQTPEGFTRSSLQAHRPISPDSVWKDRETPPPPSGVWDPRSRGRRWRGTRRPAGSRGKESPIDPPSSG